MFKYLPLVSALALVTACSHQTVKKPAMAHTPKLTGHWFHQHQWQAQRGPASTKDVPGLKEFLAAVTANKSMHAVPVGQLVTKIQTYLTDGKVEEFKEETVYLLQKPSGFFSLTNDMFSDEKFLEIHDSFYAEDVEASLQNIVAVKKLSQKNFIVTFAVGTPDFKAACDLEIDLSKSSELYPSICKDEKGTTISSSKVVSIAPVDVKSYAPQLKTITAISYPNALDCGSVSVDSGEAQACFDSIKDNEAKDWSYLLK